MIDLPVEIILLIFKNNLNLSEVLKCRSVCKKIRYIVDNFLVINELIIFEKDNYSLIDDIQWKSSCKPPDLDKLIKVCPPNLKLLLKSMSLQKLFFNLKSLNLVFSNADEIQNRRMKYEKSNVTALFEFNLDFEFLNSFKNLEELNLLKLRLFKNEILNLPNLKIFYISRILNFNDDLIKERSIFFLYVNSKVEKFGCSDINYIIFNYPEKIKYLQGLPLPSKKKYIHHFNDILKFRNLEIFHCYNRWEKYDLNEMNFYILAYLRLFKYLKELHIGVRTIRYESFRSNMDDLDVSPDFITAFKEPNWTHCDTYFCGIPINKLTDREILNQRNEFKFQFKNYEKLLYCFNHHEVNYNVLDKLLNIYKVCDDYSMLLIFSKINIKTLRIVEEVKNEDQLILVIKNCKNLKSLYFKKAYLNQSTLDRLPDACDQLLSIRFNNGNETKYNYEFIKKLKYLMRFQILLACGEDLMKIINLFMTCNSLNKIKINRDKNFTSFSIILKMDKTFLVYKKKDREKSLIENGITFSELVNLFFKKIKL